VTIPGTDVGSTRTTLATTSTTLASLEAAGSESLARTGSSAHWKLVVLGLIAVGLGYQVLFVDARRRPQSNWY